MNKKSLFNIIFGNSPSSSCHILDSKNDFLNHYEKFKPVLAQIKQTESQKSDGLRLTVKNIFEKKTTNSEDLVGLVTTLPDDSMTTRAHAVSFLDNMLSVSSKLRFKNSENQESFFRLGLDQFQSSPEELSTIKKMSLGFKNTAIVNHPHFQNAVYDFHSSLDSSSLPYLDFLIEYSKISEVLTSVALDEKIALGVGVKVFILTYYSLKNPDSLQLFLTAVKKGFQDPNSINLNNLHTVLYQKRYYFATSISAIFLTSIFRSYGTELTSAVVETGKYLPKNELVKSVFFSTRENVQSLLYMAGSIIGSARRSLVYGLFENTKPFLQDALKESTKVLKALKDSTK